MGYNVHDTTGHDTYPDTEPPACDRCGSTGDGVAFALVPFPPDGEFGLQLLCVACAEIRRSYAVDCEQELLSVKEGA
jgi:hypothetical protein